MTDERRTHCRRDTDQEGGRCYLADDSARQSAEIAVRKTFAILGVNVEDPRQVEEFREDLRFGSLLRQAARRGIFAVVVVVAGAMVGVAWMGIQAAFGKH